MQVSFSDWTVDSDARELRYRGDPVHLSPKAFRLLELLIEQRPAALSKERIFDAIWPATFVAESNLASLVKEIRSALQDDARQPKLIRTVFGYGYAFAATATVEAPPTPQIVSSVAVLPFTNSSGAEWDYISDGIADALVNALARLSSVRVVPRSTSFRYRSPTLDIKALGREMRADAIVTGRLWVRGDELTVQAELVDVKADSQVWGNRFHSRPSELLHLQGKLESEITARVAERSSEPHRERGVVTNNNEAYHLYLRGRHQWDRRDAEGFRRAIEAFQAATEIDPTFALAHSALAEAYVTLGSRDLYPPGEIFALARQAAAHALALDPSLSGAHSAMASVQELFDWDERAAEMSHRTAVSLDPHYASAAQWFALYFARRSEHEEANRWMARAVAIEPLSPIINTNAALVSYLARDFATAVRQSGVALELAPHYEGALIMNGLALTQVDPARAVTQLEEGARLSARRPYALSHLASAYAAMGRLEDARQIAEELRARARSQYVSAADIAITEIALGDRAAALAAFEAAAEQRSPWLSYLGCEPRLDPLRGEPRFQSLLALIGYNAP